MWYVIMLLAGVVIGFFIGFFVYRNNAKKFQEIEAQAVAKGKSIADVIKGI